jgi:hypothetical protein
MTASELRLEGIMKLRGSRLTLAAVAIWMVALAATMILSPAPVEAIAYDYGRAVYTPNHPNGCAPLPYDCYVIYVYPD